MDRKCKNCGRLESQHYYYYKACVSEEQKRWRFNPNTEEQYTKKELDEWIKRSDNFIGSDKDRDALFKKLEKSELIKSEVMK